MSKLAKTTFVLALSIAALTAVTAPASALVVASGIQIGDVFFAPPTVLVPINGASANLPFTLPVPARVAITFSAECAAMGGTNLNSWVDIDVLVDGVAVPPTAGINETFCTSNGASFGSWTHPSVTVVTLLSAGPHLVNILGRANGFATRGWIGDGSTVIER